MHLKEYTFQELEELLTQAGFKEIQVVFKIPAKISYFLGFMVKPKASQLYLAYLCFIENLISLLPRQAFRRKAAILIITVLPSYN